MSEDLEGRLSPEVIGERAAVIARSLEGLRVEDARTILGFVGAYLPRHAAAGNVAAAASCSG